MFKIILQCDQCKSDFISFETNSGNQTIFKTIEQKIGQFSLYEDNSYDDEDIQYIFCSKECHDKYRKNILYPRCMKLRKDECSSSTFICVNCYQSSCSKHGSSSHALCERCYQKYCHEIIKQESEIKNKSKIESNSTLQNTHQEFYDRNNTAIVKIKYLDSDVAISQSTKGSSGFDLKARYNYKIMPGTREKINTGIKVGIQSGYEGQIRSRSGLAANHGIFVLNGIGSIDSDYVGELIVILYNSSDTLYEINKGDRIAQFVFNKLPKVVFEVVEKLDDTERGENGLGSTGK